VGEQEDSQGLHDVMKGDDWDADDFLKYLKSLDGEKAGQSNQSSTAAGRNREGNRESDTPDTPVTNDNNSEIPSWSELESEAESEKELHTGPPKVVEIPEEEKYTFIQGDLLNFSDKRRHSGPSLKEQFKVLSDFTQDLTNSTAISNPKLASLIRHSHPSTEGKKAKQIMEKFTNSQPLSQREVHFVRKNRGYLYNTITEKISARIALHMKAMTTEQILLNDWEEVQGEHGESDCTGCKTRHPAEIDPHACSTRNSNGPSLAAKPLPPGNWRATMLGVVSFLSLPWTLSSSFLNLSFMNNEEYEYDLAAPLSQAVGPRDCPLGRSILDRLKLLSEAIPVFVEFSNEKGNINKTYTENLYNFLRTIRAVQRTYSPPIVVVLGLPVPNKQSTAEAYMNLKKRAAEQTNIARILGHFLGVSVLEPSVQRKPCLLAEGFEWLNTNWEHAQPLFNKHLQQTPECLRRISASLDFTLELLEPWILPDEVKGVRTNEVGEIWNS
jgi:hypothetical protein